MGFPPSRGGSFLIFRVVGKKTFPGRTFQGWFILGFFQLGFLYFPLQTVLSANLACAQRTKETSLPRRTNDKTNSKNGTRKNCINAGIEAGSGRRRNAAAPSGALCLDYRLPQLPFVDLSSTRKSAQVTSRRPPRFLSAPKTRPSLRPTPTRPIPLRPSPSPPHLARTV